jgi:hypothetical protein
VVVVSNILKHVYLELQIEDAVLFLFGNQIIFLLIFNCNFIHNQYFLPIIYCVTMGVILSGIEETPNIVSMMFTIIVG